MNSSTERKIKINKKQKTLSRNELEKLTKDELIDKITQLEAHNFQLKNILQKKLNENDRNDIEYIKLMEELAFTDSKKQSPQQSANSRNSEKTRKFDFSTMHKRHVLLKLLYFGWDYHGFACQEDSNATIENHLFKALTRTCLIESRATSNYHRCGRTDKEVSAFCQVISIDLRSKFPAELQNTPESITDEIDYCGILNRVLPSNIQCITWMPLRDSLYSARFDCTARTYRYFFPKGDLNIEAMRDACILLERHTDFRNFCKMDVHNGITNYMRNVQKAQIHLCPNETDDMKGYSMYYLEIKANAFLWHQIRCIMAILIFIGQGREKPHLIDELLDVEKNPCKPQYTPAIGLPLNLFNCDFREKTNQPEYQQEDTTETVEIPIHAEYRKTVGSIVADTTNWVYNEQTLQKLIENVQNIWAHFSIKTSMIRNVLFSLELTLNNECKPQQIKSQALLLQDGVKPKQYQNLLDRKRCKSLENRIDHFVKKQRLVIEDVEARKTKICAAAATVDE